MFALANSRVNPKEREKMKEENRKWVVDALWSAPRRTDDFVAGVHMRMTWGNLTIVTDCPQSGMSRCGCGRLKGWYDPLGSRATVRSVVVDDSLVGRRGRMTLFSSGRKARAPSLPWAAAAAVSSEILNRRKLPKHRQEGSCDGEVTMGVGEKLAGEE